MRSNVRDCAFMTTECCTGVEKMTIRRRLKRLETAGTGGNCISIPMYDGETEQGAMLAAGLTKESSDLLIIIRHWIKRPPGDAPAQG